MRMEYLLTGEEMAAADHYTSSSIGIESLVLMERAALSVAEEITGRYQTPVPVLILAGRGNNGADGAALCRLLWEKGWPAEIFYLPGSGEFSPQMEKQLSILDKLQIPAEEFSGEKVSAWAQRQSGREIVLVDALFGTGLSRPLTGQALQAVQCINALKDQSENIYNGWGRPATKDTGLMQSGAENDACGQSRTEAAARGRVLVVAVDIPSGVSATDGSLQGDAVRADVTVTFGFYKRGHFLYPGGACCGALRCARIGIGLASLQREPAVFTWLPEQTQGTDGAYAANGTGKYNFQLSRRDPDGNKGTFGKILLVAGSENMCGAATLCAKACMASGAGMVRVLSAACNRIILQETVPEALLTVYEKEDSPRQIADKVLETMKWADTVAVGPGLGRDDSARVLLRTVLLALKPGINLLNRLVLDADALRILAEEDELQSLLQNRDQRVQCILTPHMGEAAALRGESIAVCKQDPFGTAGYLAQKYKAAVICKDARTVVSAPGQSVFYLNTTGNSGMATAGSGDVLTGLTAALFAGYAGQDFRSACMAACIHGMAGDLAARQLGEYGMTAGDLARAIPAALHHGKKR